MRLKSNSKQKAKYIIKSLPKVDQQLPSSLEHFQAQVLSLSYVQWLHGVILGSLHLRMLQTHFKQCERRGSRSRFLGGASLDEVVVGEESGRRWRPGILAVRLCQEVQKAFRHKPQRASINTWQQTRQPAQLGNSFNEATDQSRGLDKATLHVFGPKLNSYAIQCVLNNEIQQYGKWTAFL